MGLLYMLEKIRMPVLNEIMLAITKLGEETAFLVLALIFFWCVDKRRGYYLMAVGFMGTILNQFLKLACKVPRPWVLNENFTILEQAREAASGYSFPSGHTTMAVGTFGGIALTEKRRWLQVICVVLALLVSFSRMYVGVHTPYDVLAGILCAVALLLVLKPLVFAEKEWTMPILLTAMLLVAVSFFVFAVLHPTQGVDPANLTSAVKNGYTMLGCMTGVVVVYFAERRWVGFREDAVWWVQIIKSVLGLAAVLAVKSGLKAPLELLFGGHMISRSVRYFLLVLIAGLLWPMTFRFWRKLGEGCQK